MNPSDLTVDELADALRRGAEGVPTETAAVELLIGHQVWLRRDTVRRHIVVSVQDGLPCADVAWEDLAFTPGPIGSRSELGVLRVAACLANGWMGDAVTSADPHTHALIVAAVDRAGGRA